MPQFPVITLSEAEFVALAGNFQDYFGLYHPGFVFLIGKNSQGSYVDYELRIGFRAPGATVVSDSLLRKGDATMSNANTISNKNSELTYQVLLYKI